MVLKPKVFIKGRSMRYKTLFTAERDQTAERLTLHGTFHKLRLPLS